ncbi:uncharacterized protein LOC126285332 [Schistocerca gregaria]|uniref:uncharacterized protein LOC126285332 n=1 Tax=Schistocerca gregaria TaxID=7010 RepID=UPI00211E89F3|nr:uncharacterized protein LOC126285332 [Schistocerca gregaria]
MSWRQFLTYFTAPVAVSTLWKKKRIPGTASGRFCRNTTVSTHTSSRVGVSSSAARGGGARRRCRERAAASGGRRLSVEGRTSAAGGAARQLLRSLLLHSLTMRQPVGGSSDVSGPQLRKISLMPR